MTPKQSLMAHMKERHGVSAPRGTHKQLIQGHRINHTRHLTHGHRPDGWVDGRDMTECSITLCPPKNPSATRNGDRNWVLHIAYLSEGRGWRWELAGTWEGDTKGAKEAANKELGWVANWVINETGYGYQHKEKTHD